MRTKLRVKLAVLQLAETLKEVTPRLIRVLLIIGLISGVDWIHSPTIRAAPSLQAQPIIVRSGNGVRGSQDTLVRVLSYRRTGDISPTPADFVNAQTAPFAYIVPPYSSYIARLPNDPSAQWLAVNPQMAPHTALYAVPFEVTDSVITAASLDFFFSVDNAVNGVYIRDYINLILKKERELYRGIMPRAKGESEIVNGTSGDHNGIAKAGLPIANFVFDNT